MNITENNRLKKRIIVKYFFKENCFSLFLLPAFIFLQNPDTNLHLIECNLNDILQNIFRKYRSIFIYKAVKLRYTDCNLKIVAIRFYLK